jgi:predicted component of type VI protein secretion system
MRQARLTTLCGCSKTMEVHDPVLPRQVRVLLLDTPLCNPEQGMLNSPLPVRVFEFSHISEMFAEYVEVLDERLKS